MVLRAALVGCGLMSRAWLEATAKIDGLEIVGLADIDPAKASARAAEFGLTDAVIASDIDGLLASTKVDVLFDVVVPEARHRVVSAALDAGCHVLSEKPMAASLAEARDLIKRADAAHRIHAVIQNRRYLSAVRKIARALRAGAIGELTSIHADFFIAPHFGGFREEMNHVLLLDMAIHAFDAMRCMSNLAATRVYCREWDPAGSWYHQGSSALAIFDLDNGALFTYRGSWAAEGTKTSWESAWRFQGTKGSLSWDGFDAIKIEVAATRTALLAETMILPSPEPSDDDHVDGHLGVLRDFVAAIRDGHEPETVGRENIKSLAMVFGAIESAETGNPVHLTI